MRKISKRRIIAYVAVVVLLIFLYFFGFLRPAENIISRVLNPVYSRFYKISSGIKIRYDDQISKKDLLEIVNNLEVQVNDLTKENVDLNLLQEENETLREHLRFSIVDEKKYVMANVISRGDAITTSDRIETIVINKGSRDGVYSGLSVVSGKGVVVGKIEEVKNNISKVYLTNNKKCKLTATILTNDRGTSGVTEGELGLTVRMGFIPQDILISKGDVVITSGLEQVIPRGLVIGKVIDVKKENNELWQTAVIESSANLDELLIVSVLLP